MSWDTLDKELRATLDCLVNSLNAKQEYFKYLQSIDLGEASEYVMNKIAKTAWETFDQIDILLKRIQALEDKISKRIEI